MLGRCAYEQFPMRGFTKLAALDGSVHFVYDNIQYIEICLMSVILLAEDNKNRRLMKP